MEVNGQTIPEAINVDSMEVATAEPVLEVVSDDSLNDNVQKKIEDSKEEEGKKKAIPEISAPHVNTSESNNVLSDYISNDLINENMFNMTEIKNTLLNALKIEFGK